jgi:Domain of unknown function (DUF1990)
MQVENIEKRTARGGWFSRLRGFLAQFAQGTQRRVRPLPPPPEIPPDLIDAEVQLEGDGFGKLLGRYYEVRFHSQLQPEALMARVKRNVTKLSPDELAAFEKTSGTPWALRLGDEFDITIWGPWNGRVRVIEITPDSFSFLTLRGHPEAGRIRFAVTQLSPGLLRFNITSWARSRDAMVDLTYDKLSVAKTLQANTWRTFLERVVELGEGSIVGNVEVSEQTLEAS